MNYKELINLISQEAAILEKRAYPHRSRGPKSQIPSHNPSSAVPAPGIGYSKDFSNVSVIEMQNAMKELAQEVTYDATSTNMARRPVDTVNNPASTNTLVSKKSFNDFIAEQYIDSDDNSTGVEWDKNPNIVTLPEKQKTQTNIHELDVVMDTLQRIGMPKSELKADGNWEFRTNNALKNMAAFSYALLQLEDDFGLHTNVYSVDMWRDFSKSLDSYKVENGFVKLDPQSKKQMSEKFTIYLKRITKLYNHFRRMVGSRPAYRKVIEGKEAFETYNQSGSNKDILTEGESYWLSKMVPLHAPNDVKISNVNYPTPKGGTLNYIPIKALTSKEEYMKWMESLGVDDQEQAIKLFNNSIKKQIDALTTQQPVNWENIEGKRIKTQL